MIVSVNWLKKFTEISLPIDELATLIGARLVEIEEVIDLGVKYKDVIIVKVIECEPLEGSDHLSVAKVDDGGTVKDIERDEKGYIQVVCGAPNIRAGLTVAWLPPGAAVPQTYGKSEPFVLEARTIRGVKSNGMIASSRELDLHDDHTGIIELDPTLATGSHFKDVFELDDYLLDIENKSLTHRPDTFGIIGFAREVAGIQEKAFTTPDWLKDLSPAFVTNATDSLPAPTITIDDPELSARYQAIILTGADGNILAPLNMQTYLARVGVRPISAVVDVTNYMMMLTGQPLHAFDYDKLIKVGGGKADIHVRAARKGETLKLLDGRTVDLHPEDIVIAAGETPVALAGAMGGADTEIDENTKTIILESATFNLYNLRATQMRHGIFSEAITRFTKGQPAGLTAPVLHEAVRLLGEYAGAKVASSVAEAYPGGSELKAISLSAKDVNQTLGSNLTIEDMIDILKNVEFDVTMTDDGGIDPKGDGILHVKAPYWRADIHIPEDIIEEIGRLYGFDNIEPVLPMRDFTAVRSSEFDLFRSAIRRHLVRAGASEVLTYSFVHGDVLTKAAQKPEDSYRITNSISPSLQYYRQTLTPSLLGLIHPNIKQGFDQFAVFELNKVHPKPHGLTDEGVPGEIDMLALTFASKSQVEGAPYYYGKRYVDFLMDKLGIGVAYVPIEVDPNYPVTAPFEYRRSALVTDRDTAAILGIVGEYKKSVLRGFKLPDFVSGFELDTGALFKSAQQNTQKYRPLSRYPGTERDICFKVAADSTYQELVEVVAAVLDNVALETSIEPVDIYQGEDTTTKHTTIRIHLTSHEKTLTSDEVAAIINLVTTAVESQLKATVI